MDSVITLSRTNLFSQSWYTAANPSTATNSFMKLFLVRSLLFITLLILTVLSAVTHVIPVSSISDTMLIPSGLRILM